MLLFKQLDLFEQCSRPALPGRLVSGPHGGPPQRAGAAPWLQQRLRSSRDAELETKARELLSRAEATRLARFVRVEWNPRLQTCAGRAHFRDKLISLNPRLCDHDTAEIDRTLRHELAHLLAQFRAGRRRILPHGAEWRDACRDLGMADETRCHNLPFPVKNYAARFLYRCPNCFLDFPRVRRIRRAMACLACCRVYNHGRFDARFRLVLVKNTPL
jgi:predicted SprT family Zn-dependent metalloprotease